MDKNIDEHADRGHSSFGGSVASIAVNCTGSVFLSSQLPPQPPTHESLEGTKAHEISEMLLAVKLNFETTGELEQLDVPVEDVTILKHAEQYVQDIWKKVLGESITNKGWGIEDRFYVSKELNMFGYVDFWCVYIDDRGKRVLCVCDFKYGFVDVFPDKNIQLIYYAVAIRNYLQENGKDIDHVRLVVYQPRTAGDSFKEWKTTPKLLDQYKAKFLKAGREVFIEKKHKFKTGTHCKYCKAKTICEAYQFNLKEELKMDLYQPEKLPVLETIPIEQIVKLVLFEKEINNLLSEAKKYLLAKAYKGTTLPNCKIVKSRPRRQWVQDEEFVISKLQEVGTEEVFTKKLKALTTVEKELKDKIGKDEVSRLFSFITTLSTPGITIAPESDPREAVDILGISDFKIIEG